MASVIQFPQQVPFVDSRNRIDYRWLRALEAFLENIPDPNGTQGVTDGSASTYAPMTLFQGADSAKPGVAEPGWLYFALDTGKIYRAQGSTWDLLSEALTGDVTKPAGSTVTSLANVFFSPGTYGGATQTPVLTVDAKGRITDLWFENIPTGNITPAGSNGSLQFNQDGVLGGSLLINYNPANGALIFTNPGPTRENLSPLTTKGDIFVRGASASTRLPVGQNNQFLMANSAVASGLEWVTSREVDIPFQWNVISTFPLITVPAGVLVKSIRTYIEVPFDGVGATLTIGDAGNNSSLQENIYPYEAAGYESNPGLRYEVDTPIALYINPGSASQGSGLICIELQQRN